MSTCRTVSVVIGVRNGAPTLGSCLESLLEQDYPKDAYDVIVVENGSTDQTTAVARRYPVRLLHNPEPGLAAARNLGISKSDADVIATTDADCVAAPDWLRTLLPAYDDDLVGGAAGQVVAWRREVPTNTERYCDEHPPLVNYVSGEHEFLPHFCGAHASFRRQLILDVGGYNPRLLTGEDVDISWRIQLETRTRLQFVPQSTIYHQHRTDAGSFARMYRQYGFGEILLDTRFGRHPGYPRGRTVQMRRMSGQCAAIPRYAVSAVVRAARRLAGRATSYDATEPWLAMLAESSNLLGKVEGIVATRLMTDASRPLEANTRDMVARFYGSAPDDRGAP